jgi:hypothetical protein
VHQRGDELADVLARALASALPGADDRWTHGFHSWPARMHPELAAVLCHALVKPGMRVLDPFCGSGTVLLEAMAAGGIAWGVDLHPLALRIAELRCMRTSAAERTELMTAVEAVAETTLGLVRARADVRAPLSGEERHWYASHVLRELACLHASIADAPPRWRPTLEILFSAIVVKFSRQRAGTSAVAVDKTIGKGVPTKFFARKGHELVERLHALADALPPDAVAPVVRLGDARGLVDVVADGAPFQLVITSPPYAGTYDYVDHHARREPWLGIRSKALREREIGARRHYALDSREVVARWDHEVTTYLRSMRSVLSEQGTCVLLVGDGEIGRTRVPADKQIERLAPAVGLRVRAVASQPRVDWRGGKARAEHLVALAADVADEPERRRRQPGGGTSTRRKVQRRRRGS